MCKQFLMIYDHYIDFFFVKTEVKYFFVFDFHAAKHEGMRYWKNLIDKEDIA